MASRTLHHCLTLLLLVLLSGCSATRLAYQNADWLIEQGLEEYVDFTSDQSRQLDVALDRHLQWHCRTQLPRYIDWLEQVKRTASSSPVNQSEVSRRIDELGDFLQDIAYEITPTTISLLGQLSDRQVVEMKKHMADRQRELEEKHLKPSVGEQVRKRSERLEERLERWLGRLTDRQRERISEWSRSQADRNRQWLGNRKRWQMTLLDAVENRQQPGFRNKVTDLLQRPARFHPPEWQIRNLAYREAAVNLATDLLRMATDEQRNHLRHAVTELQEDFTALLCR